MAGEGIDLDKMLAMCERVSNMSEDQKEKLVDRLMEATAAAHKAGKPAPLNAVPEKL